MKSINLHQTHARLEFYFHRALHLRSPRVRRCCVFRPTAIRPVHFETTPPNRSPLFRSPHSYYRARSGIPQNHNHMKNNNLHQTNARLEFHLHRAFCKFLNPGHSDSDNSIGHYLKKRPSSPLLCLLTNSHRAGPL